MSLLDRLTERIVNLGSRIYGPGHDWAWDVCAAQSVCRRCPTVENGAGFFSKCRGA